MEKKRSKVWTFFTPVTEDKAKCDLCQTLYSVKGGSTTNLKKHLRHKHKTLYPYDITVTTSSSPTVSLSQKASEQSITSVLPSTSSSITEAPIATISINANRQVKQTTISTFLRKPLGVAREKKLNNLILNMIVKDLQPFSIVEDDGFKSLINYLEPDYKIPTRNTLSTTFLDAQYTAVANKVKEELRSASHISITSDGWTSRTMTSYQAITAHYLKNWELKSALLGCFECHERHTAENIKTEIIRLLSEWEIKDKIFACVTDSAANMKKAVRLTGFEHFPCVAHVLNLIVRAGLRTSEMDNIIKKVKSIVEHFHRSSVATQKLILMQEQLRSGQKPLKLKMDVVTRWNSTLDMIERILFLQEPLEAALGALHHPVPNLLEADWQALPDIVEILNPFKELTEQMSSETQVTISMVIPAIDSISRIFDSLYITIQTDIGKNLLFSITTEFNTRFKNFSKNPILSKAALLDPRFKKLAFRETSAYTSARNELKLDIENIVNVNRRPRETETQTQTVNESTSTSATDTAIPKPNDDNSIWREFDANAKACSSLGARSTVAASIITIRQFRQYTEEKIIGRLECPLKWWQERAILYPELSYLAEKYLTVMATSVPSERTFSKSGLIISDRRSSLKPKRMEKILFLNMNKRLIN